MAWKIEDAEEIGADLESIFEHLHASHVAFGNSRADAARLAVERVRRIDRARDRLARTPHLGTRHDLGGLAIRHVTLDRAIYWFELREESRTIRFLGIFHGGQEHWARMADRLSRQGEGQGGPADAPPAR